MRATEPADVERLLRQCRRMWTLAPRTYPRGVFKFRTIADMRHPDPDDDLPDVPSFNPP